MPARPHIRHRLERLIKVTPFWTLSHAIGHRTLLSIHDELGHGTMHAGLVPTGRVPDIIRACMNHGLQGRRAFIAGLRIKGFCPTQSVRRPPRHVVVARHLTDHKVHQADFRGARHWCPGFHRNRRQVMAINRRRAFADHLRIGQRRQRLCVQLCHRRRHRGRRIGTA